MARKNEEKTAQNDTREKKQKERFGLDGDHSRDAKYDAFYKMPIDLKTRNPRGNGHVSTKRKFKLETLKEWENTIILVSDYDKDGTSLLENDYLIFPDALIEWREEQRRALTHSNRASYYTLDDIQCLRDSIETIDENIEEIFRKLETQLHLNDPKIGKTLFSSNGTQIMLGVNKKKVKTKHPEWFITVPNNINKAKFVRQEIDNYMNWRKHNGSKS